ncbi:phage shock protein C, PspC [Methanohalobium evestigatum Z-7303]|uniref:Phage shock protein C, PspC n=1 Tax=Methanohalobium evestigatum (strain ATCC BAA-1072 / DSM 3721 / NBRC 107634 / OCM 161 / Z-7303) TaxID=644295 RepID=D7EA24_METEZ|nr:PspC domain-containing protein [Methanohalobium evestigatum]ADI74695.1 phage shock protein C, PspC [Methanohalobium evestigatum Z-7303]
MEDTDKTGRDKLTKSKSDRMLAGVCGGIAEYFDVDPVLVRVAFVVLALVNGLGILLYIILAIVMPEPENNDKTPEQNTTSENGTDEYSENDTYTKTQHKSNRTDRTLWLGVILIILGIFLIIDRFNVFWWLGWDVLWPGILILIGFWIITRVRR